MKKTYLTPEFLNEKLCDLDVITASGEVVEQRNMIDYDNNGMSVFGLN